MPPGVVGPGVDVELALVLVAVDEDVPEDGACEPLPLVDFVELLPLTGAMDPDLDCEAEPVPSPSSMPVAAGGVPQPARTRVARTVMARRAMAFTPLRRASWLMSFPVVACNRWRERGQGSGSRSACRP